MAERILRRQNLDSKTFCDGATKDLYVLKKLYYYFFVFFVLYIEFGYRMVIANTVSGTIRTAGLLLLCVPLLFSLFKIKIPMQPVALLLYLTSVILLNMLRDVNKGNYILLFVAIFVGFVTAMTINFKHLVHVFVNIVVFLAGFSLLVFATRALLPEVLNNFPILWDPFDTTSAQIRDIGFSVVLVNTNTLRNFGFAWEPGAFAILLCAALYCNVTFYKKLNIVKTVILTITIITTFSTMGYIVLAIIYLVSIKRSYKHSKSTIIFLLFALMLLVFFMFLPTSVIEVVFSKLSGIFSNSAAETTQARLDAIEYPLKAFLGSPIIGVGYDRFAIINKEQCNNVATNTIVNWFASMGVLFGVPCTFFYLNFASKSARFSRGGLFKFLLLATVFVLMVSTQSLLRISFIYVIIFFGCQKNLFYEEKLKQPKTKKLDTRKIEEVALLENFSTEESLSLEIDEFVIQQNLERYRQNKAFTQNVSFENESKILFILGMYHPKYSANGISCKNVIDECVNQGYDVSCIVNDYHGEKKEDVINGAKIYRIKHRLFDRVLQWCERNTDKVYSAVIRKIAYLVNKVKLLITSPMWPFISPLYSYRFYRKAKKLHKKENFDTIVCVYTPFDAVMAGYMLKKKYPEIRFIPYYLDAFAGGWGPSVWSDEKRDRRTRKWETFIDKKADVIVSMESSRKYHEANPLELPDLFKRKFLDVPLMRDVKKTKTQDKGTSTKTLLFAGGLSFPRRDPRPILDVLLKVCEDSDIQAIFLGECNKPSIFEPYCEKSGGKIKYMGQQPHNIVLEMGEKADCFINIGSRNPFTISGKIFEYMSFGKPIISTYYIENEPSKEYLEKYGFTLLIDEKKDIEESANELKKFLKEIEGKQINCESIGDIFYENTPKAFVDMLRTEI